MKKKAIGLLLICLFAFSSTAFATNWVLVKKSTHPGATQYDNIDSDTVVKDGNILMFWISHKIVWSRKTDIIMVKTEVSLTEPRQYRSLEFFSFVNGKETNHTTTPAKFSDPDIKDFTDMALKYVKEGKDDGSIPTPP